MIPSTSPFAGVEAHRIERGDATEPHGDAGQAQCQFGIVVQRVATPHLRWILTRTKLCWHPITWTPFGPKPVRCGGKLQHRSRSGKSAVLVPCARWPWTRVRTRSAPNLRGKANAGSCVPRCAPPGARRRRRAAPAATPPEKLIEAGQSLVLEGDGQFTVKELADRAGVALQTFYRHFGSKDELVLAVLEENVAQGVRDMEAIAAIEPDPVDQLRELIQQPIRMSTGHRNVRVGLRFHARERQRLVRALPERRRSGVRALPRAGRPSHPRGRSHRQLASRPMPSTTPTS